MYSFKERNFQQHFLFDSVAPYIFFLFVALVSLSFIAALVFPNKTPDSKEVLFLTGDYEKAFKIWSRIANDGQEEAQMMVGMSNYVGFLEPIEIRLSDGINWLVMQEMNMLNLL